MAEAGATPRAGWRSADGGVTAWSVMATSCGLGAMLCRAPEAAWDSAATALPPASAAAAANCRNWFRRESYGQTDPDMTGQTERGGGCERKPK